MNERTSLIGGDEPGFWSRRTTLQKSLIILLGVAVVALVVVAIALTVGKGDDTPDGGSTPSPTDAPTGGPTTHEPTTASPTTPPPIISICQSEMCHAEADRIRQNMNSAADPCDDFYEYVCGDYQSNHTLPDDKGRYGTFDAVDENVNRRLREMYGASYVPKELKSLTFVRKLFQTCNDSDLLEGNGVEPLLQVLERIGGWPLADNNTGFNESTYNFFDAFSHVVGKLGSNILLNVVAFPDPKNTSNYIVTMDQPDFGVGRSDLINYKNDTKSKELVDAYRKYIKATSSLLSENITIDDVDQQVEDLVDFEVMLAEKSTAPEDRRNHEETYHKYTFTKLAEVAPSFDWMFTVNQILTGLGLPKRVTLNDEVVVLDLPYLQALSGWLTEKLPNNRTILANYLGWRLLQNTGFMSTEKFRQNEFDFLSVQEGIKKAVPLWKRCMNVLTDQTPALVGRSYVDAYFTEDDVKAASDIVKFVEASYQRVLKEKDWLDAETKEKALKKLDAILSNVGYPEWVKDNDKLRAEFNFTEEVDPTDPFKSSLYLRQFTSAKQFAKLGKKVDKSYEWPMGPAVVNAAYEPTQNSITIPAGILQLVFFNESRPNYLNYGSIGAVIGHELTHGFDDEGAQYDLYGNLDDWWSNKTHNEFNMRAKCFIDQYGSIIDDRVNMSLNGRNTLGENIADNGGLREAYQAYHMLNDTHLELEGLLPGFTDYTYDQLFFISYGNNWCSLIRDEKLRQSILYDPHSPPKYRVNVPVSNFDKFGEAFQCKAGARMNPGRRCVLW